MHHLMGTWPGAHVPLFQHVSIARGCRDVDPEHGVGGGVVRPEAEKKIVTWSIFIANCVAEELPMVLQ